MFSRRGGLPILWLNMRFRLISLIALMSFVLVACGEEEVAPTSTSTTMEPVPETTVADQPEVLRLSYALEPGTSLKYELTISQRIGMTASGDPEMLAEEGMPLEAVIDLEGTTVFTYEVEEGPQPGTFEVTIRGEFSDLQMSGTVDGEPVDPDEAPEFAMVEPIEVTIVVDEKGNIVGGDDLLGDIFGGGLDMFDFAGSGSDLGQFFGPSFPDRDLAVGDSWTETFESPALFGMDPVTTTVESVIVGTDTVDGADVLVIDTVATTSQVEFDLGDFFAGFLWAMLPDEATDDEVAELEEMLEQVRFLFQIAPSASEMTTWFDPAVELPRRWAASSVVHLLMDMNVPDEETGELVALGMEMSLDQEFSSRLIES